jgi:hypothetical protein
MTKVLVNCRDGGCQGDNGAGGLADVEAPICIEGHWIKAPQHETCVSS